MSFSNSWVYEMVLGWTGICVEPNTEVYKKLVQERNCKCFNVCAYNSTTSIQFMECTGKSEMLSGIVDCYRQHITRVEGEQGDKVVCTKNAVKTQELLDECNITHIDFLSLDVEGSEVQGLEGIDWSKTKVSVAVIEANYEEDEKNIASFMKSKNYMLYAKTQCDLIFIHPEVSKYL